MLTEASEANVGWSSNSSGRRRAVLLPLGFLMLSLAVFGWGLQYKLSLYQSKDSVTHLAPEAKLLSQKERPATTQELSTRSVDVPAFPFIAVFVAVVASLLLQACARFLRAGSKERSRPSRPPCIQAVFFRPPPILT